MPELIYVANNRLPTEKAHGLQITQMCEAFAQVGYAVTLVAPRRINTPEMRAAGPLWAHYGVEPIFAFRRLPLIDLFPLFPRHGIAFITQTLTFGLALALWLLPRRLDVLYTRDLFLAAWLALFRPRTTLVYEAHALHRSRLGRALERFVVKRARVIALTAHLADALRAQGADSVLVEHDAVRAARFAGMPSRAEARAALGWSQEAFIIGWVGRLVMLGLDKGVGQLVEALQTVDAASLAIVGGPADAVGAIRARWLAAGLDEDRFLAVGQVLPSQVPLYLGAFDACVMPHPWTEQFAYHTSPIKLFEYMAAGRAIVASNLPAFAEVLTHGKTALLVPPGDTQALSSALTRLRDDPALRERLGETARAEVFTRYTWKARAAAIRAFVEAAR